MFSYFRTSSFHIFVLHSLSSWSGSRIGVCDRGTVLQVGSRCTSMLKKHRVIELNCSIIFNCRTKIKIHNSGQYCQSGQSGQTDICGQIKFLAKIQIRQAGKTGHSGQLKFPAKILIKIQIQTC